MRTLDVFRFIALTALLAGAGAAFGLTPQEQLGKSIFFDVNLSIDGNQACAACHAPEWGWTGPIPGINEAGAVYEGSIQGRFGNRKPPSSPTGTKTWNCGFRSRFNSSNAWDG